jgi:hypothetical protein
LPENPASEWEAMFPREQWEAAVYRLGNLTLLESHLNRRVGNSLYPEKVAAYGQSKYELTRRVTDTAPAEWTLAILDERQRQLARRAVHVWRPDFT